MSSTCSLRLMLRSLGAAALAAVFVWPSIATAQSQSQPSLAELAKQEAARRKTVKDTKKVITTKDLPESARRPAAAGAPAEGGAAEGGGDQKPAAAAAAAGEAAPDDRGEAVWRQRMTAAREGLRRNEVFLDALQMRVNGLTADYDRHDPFERNGIGETRKKALEEIEHVKADIAASKKQIADIEEDARKAGVPAGWVR